MALMICEKVSSRVFSGKLSHKTFSQILRAKFYLQTTCVFIVFISQFFFKLALLPGPPHALSPPLDPDQSGGTRRGVVGGDAHPQPSALALVLLRSPDHPGGAQEEEARGVGGSAGELLELDVFSLLDVMYDTPKEDEAND